MTEEMTEELAMLKSLFFFVILMMGLSVHAGATDYERCASHLDYYFLASESESRTVCSQNSSPAFVQCMVDKGTRSSIDVLDAAAQCGGRRMKIPVEIPGQNYNNFKSCPSKLQVNTGMAKNRAEQICQWDPSDLMQNCLADLVQKARFHSEHAIQYCGFAAKEYRNKIPQFVSCVINNSFRGYDVYSNVANCDYQIAGGKVIVKPQPRSQDKWEPQQPAEPSQPPYYNDNEKTQPEVVAPAQPARPSNRKVPVPVEIKIEESSNPEVADKNLDTGSTSNSDSLPL
jgi:hypothetical protein